MQPVEAPHVGSDVNEYVCNGRGFDCSPAGSQMHSDCHVVDKGYYAVVAIHQDRLVR